MKVEKKRKVKIINIVVDQIKEDPELYDEHYNYSKFNGDMDLNFSALNAFATVTELDFKENKSDWIIKVTDVLENVFKFKCRKTLDHLILPLWKEDTEEAFNLSEISAEILAAKRNELDNPKLLAKTVLDSLLNAQFWVNPNDSWKEEFIKYYLDILDAEKTNQTQKDDICRVWLTDFLNINDDTFRSKYINLRQELYSRLSTNKKANSLNQIWTRIKKNLEDGIDLQFFEEHFIDVKKDDKFELFEELFEQLNSAETNAVKLFIKYGTNSNIINENVNLWVDKIIPIIRRNPNDSQTQQIIKAIKLQTKLLENAKQYKEMDELINPIPETPVEE